MRYTMTIPEDVYSALAAHFFSTQDERAAFLFCNLSQSEEETRLLVSEVRLVGEDEVEEASPAHMKIPSSIVAQALKRADEQQFAVVFVHSHPKGLREFSKIDDEEEEKLFRTAHIRIDGVPVHGSLVVTPGTVFGRVWPEGRTPLPLDTIRVFGKRLLFYFNDESDYVSPLHYDRQVRAFGKEVQRVLGRIRVGVVGAGGTGSAVIGQLIRLGVGHIMILDGQKFEATNVNRVYGSSLLDEGVEKVTIQERLANQIGLGTSIRSIPRAITEESVCRELRGYDVLFGCTDDEWGRSILTRLAVYYYIPVFDLGVKIDPEENAIRSIQGRVTTLLPPEACLFCRGRLRPERIRAEVLEATNPDEAEALRREGYIAGLDDPAPSVIPFTSAVASTALQEFVHRLTGYLGNERASSEVVHLFDQSRIRTNRRVANPDCWCQKREIWGKGDTTPFLGLTWPTT